MKKILAILLAAMMLLSFAACNPANLPSGTDSTEQGENNGGNNNNNHDNGSSGKSNDKDVFGRADMENWISERISAIGGPASISFFDGNSFDYTQDGFFFAGDYWTVKGVTASWDEIEASLDEQLLSKGFKKTTSLLGVKWYLDAGSEQMGFTVGLDGDEATIWMSHATADYNQAYIDAAIEKMPDIIAGRTALDKLPANFKIVYDNTYEETVTAIRLNDNWYFKTVNNDPEEYGYGTHHSYAYIMQNDGSYRQYSYWSGDSNPRWDDDGLITLETLDGRIESFFDADGSTASISTYLQICLEKQEGEDAFDLFEQPSRDFDFSDSLVKTGTATIAGVSCVVASTDDIWSANKEFTYDPVTGILFKLRSFGNNYPEELEVEIVEYDLNPTALGDFVQP